LRRISWTVYSHWRWETIIFNLMFNHYASEKKYCAIFISGTAKCNASRSVTVTDLLYCSYVGHHQLSDLSRLV
jgi:hypothetical protein